MIASHERTELRSLRERFCSTNSFSTTNPKDRSLIVVKVSSITDPSLIQWTDGRGRPAFVFAREKRAERCVFVCLVRLGSHSCMCHVMCRIVVDDGDEEVPENDDDGDDGDSVLFAMKRQRKWMSCRNQSGRGRGARVTCEIRDAITHSVLSNPFLRVRGSGDGQADGFKELCSKCRKKQNARRWRKRKRKEVAE